jgi:hypothetical protein
MLRREEPRAQDIRKLIDSELNKDKPVSSRMAAHSLLGVIADLGAKSIGDREELKGTFVPISKLLFA